MNKKLFLLIALTLVTSLPATAGVKRLAQDIKLPSQQVLEKQTITTPSAADTNSVASGLTGNTGSGAITITAGLTDPDVPRNLVITPGGSTTDVAACTITVSGKDFLGNSITEDFAFEANASTATTGAKAFKTVTSVAFPAGCEDSPYDATWDIGVGEKIGLSRCMDSAGHYVFSTVAGAYESTRGTVAVNSTAVSGNTIDFNGTMNGSNSFEVFFVQNFRCQP